jgi:hypothetical protein
MAAIEGYQLPIGPAARRAEARVGGGEKRLQAADLVQARQGILTLPFLHFYFSYFASLLNSTIILSFMLHLSASS